MDAYFEQDETAFNYRVVGVWINDNHILIHKNVKDDFWSLPGGRVEVGEESRFALQREFMEELGYQVKVDQLLWTVENFFEYDEKNFHEIGLYFLISATQEVDFLTEPFYGIEGERLIYKWVKIEELDETPLLPDFLTKELKHIEDTPNHLIVKQPSPTHKE